MASSQNGFDALDSSDPRLHRWVIPGCEREFTLRYGAAGFILIHLMMWFHQKIERLDIGTYDDWGFAFREVRGGSDLSNHGSGTALDANAVRHPLGARGTFGAVKTAKIRARLVMYALCIRWGGNYVGRADEMHFEINMPLSTCEFVAKRLMKTRRGKRILAANPGQGAIIYS